MSAQDESVRELLKLYNDIDAFLRRQYKGEQRTEHSFLIQQVALTHRVVAMYETELTAVAKLRNSIVHNPMGDIAPSIAIPHPAVVERYRHIRDALVKPKPALSIAVPASKIYTATQNTVISEVLGQMDRHTFTHVPILEDNKMVGIFSENTLVSYLAENKDAIIMRDMKIAEFKAYLPLKSHRGEYFAFLPREAQLDDVYTLFNDSIKKRERIGMVFITEHGKASEKPIGIITAWDLANPQLSQR